MKRLFLVVLVGFMALAVQGQILRDMNFRHQYDPKAPIAFTLRVERMNDGFIAYYALQQQASQLTLNALTLELETRSSTAEKSGTSILVQQVALTDNLFTGSVNFSTSGEKILVAKISFTDKDNKNTYVFYANLPAKKAPYITVTKNPVQHSYVRLSDEVVFSDFIPDKPVIISYYNDPFPAAAPPFATAQAKVSALMKADSLFTLAPNSTQTFSKKGLYLAQQDTASTEGVAFRVEDDYPKLGKLESLAGPLIYICTKEEYERLIQAGADKKKFDQVILSITGNTDRAKIFMRNYFKRVEAANALFSSYKEGWKTDRGMIYLIFGVPEEVYRFEDREVWEYRGDRGKLRFHFIKSATVFDPENYVLIRDKKFSDDWYRNVDLWRKARF